jgi:anti-sigma-K factor RskA
VILDEVVSQVLLVAVLLFVGGTLFTATRAGSADPRWRSAAIVARVAIVAVLVMAAAGLLYIVSSDDPAWRF